jgi:hypothetical protein
MNAHQAVRESAHTRIVFAVTAGGRRGTARRRAGARLRSPALPSIPPLGDVPADPEHEERGQDADEEDVAGRQVGHQVDGGGGEHDADVDAALEHGRDPGTPRFGHVSESSDEPTAHSPPIPRAARNRKIKSCHQACAA